MNRPIYIIILPIICLYVTSLAIFSYSRPCLAAEPSASQIERSQDLIDKQIILDKRINQEPKTFIKQIVIGGANLLTREEINNLLLEFKQKWFAKDEIERLIDKLAALYKNKNAVAIPEISYSIKNAILEITVDEKSQCTAK